MKTVFTLMAVLVMSALTLKAHAMMGPSAGGGGVPPAPRALGVVFHHANAGVDEKVKTAVLKLAAVFMVKGQLTAMGDMGIPEGDDRATVCLQFKDLGEMYNAEAKFRELAARTSNVEVVSKSYCFEEVAPKIPQFPGGGPMDPQGPTF